MDNKNSYRLRVHNLSKHFVLHQRGGKRIQGFTDVSFSVRRGELLALTGVSGSGKSSALKTIYRTYIPSRGRIILESDDDSAVDLACCSESEILSYRRHAMGFVTQFLKILPRISALDAVAAPLLENGVDREEARQRAADLLDALNIRRELFNVSPLTFSGGEQQRINIARGVIAPRKLLLLDEPTASLDEDSAGRVLKLLHRLKKQSISMIGIFHDRERMEQVADSEYQMQLERL